MQVKLHHGQLEVANDKHRFRVICAGRRWGKSVLSQLILLQWATQKPGLYWIVSPSYRQAKQIHWRQLQTIVPRQWIVKKNEVELSITLKNGSILELKGAENPDALRGVKLRGLVVDEIASIRNWDWLWSEVLRATLTDYEAPALFISTPKGYNHFYDLYNLGQQLSESQYKSWRFTSYDNPYIKGEELDAAKKELTEDTFQQEYMADFRRFTGAIFKSFSREINVIEPFDIPETWKWGRGFDFGANDPTASLLQTIDDSDNWFTTKSYKRTDTIDGHTQLLKAENYGKSFVPCFGDPTGGQWFTEFTNRGFPILLANKQVNTGQKTWVNYGYDLMDTRFKPIVGHDLYLPNGKVIHNAPKWLIFNTSDNQMFIKELENAAWKENRDGSTQPVIDEIKDREGHFDLVACGRYFAVSFKKQDTYHEPLNDISNRNWSLSDNWYPVKEKDKFRIGS